MVGAGVVPRGGQEHGRDIPGPLITTLILTSESQLALSDRVFHKLLAPGSTIPRGSTLTRFFLGPNEQFRWRKYFFQFSSRVARMLRFALNSLESVIGR